MIDQLRRLAALILVFVVVVNAGTAAARGIPLIRDAEIEDTIRGYAEPLFRAAGLDPSAITVHIVRDPGLNAFVAGGQRLFIHTGLILAAERPNNLVGVIAHETGHISGGHLARTHQALQNAQVQTIIAMVLGAAAAVASGRGDAGGAIIAGGAGSAQRLFLSYSRTQEAAADHAGLSFLEATGQSASGLLDFFEILGDQDVLINNRSQDPYIRSHPLTRDRINTVRNHVAQSRFSARGDPPEIVIAHKRMQAKLRGFLGRPRSTLRRYPVTDTSIEARYARAAAYHRAARLDEALAEIDSLLAERPTDPYYNELKGQILYEHGRVNESIEPYEKAVRLRPGSPLLRVGLAQSQIATGNSTLNAAAIQHLEAAVGRERDYTGAWHQLSIAYGRSGRLGLSALASAEQHLSTGNFKTARDQALRAQQKLPEGSPGSLRAQDIERAAMDGLKKSRGQ
jgi:predicted Zn-dependent protease